MEELQRMLELVSHEDPQLRRYAITQIEYLAESQDTEEIVEALKNASRDPVEFVRHQANRSLSTILSRGMGTNGPRPDETKSPARETFEGVTIDELKRAGLTLLAPLLDQLRVLASSPDADLARRAIVALGKVADLGAVPVLSSTMLEPERCKVSAVALSRVAGEGALGPLLAAARNTDPMIRAQVLLELGSFRKPEALAVLEENTRDLEATVRANVAAALGRIPGREEALGPLLSLIRDPEVFVVLDAIKSLGECGGDVAVSGCLEVLRQTQDDHVKAAIFSTMGRIGSPLAQPALESALRDGNDRVRANAIESLGQLRGVEATEVHERALELLTDPNNRVRANAALIVARQDPDRSMAAVQEMLHDLDVWMRASAAYALGQLRTPRAIEELVKLLAGESETEVLLPAIKALDRMENPPSAEPILRLLEHSSPAIRTRAARILGSCPGGEILEPLRQKFEKESDTSVRATLITAVGNRPEGRGIRYVTSVLDRDVEPRVQANAIEVLAHHGGIPMLSHIRPHIGSSDNRVKANAAVALFRFGEFEVLSTLTRMFDPSSPRQQKSAIFAVGEIGRTIAGLGSGGTGSTLLHALKNKYQSSAMLHQRPPALPPPEIPSHGLDEDVIAKVFSLWLTARPEETPATLDAYQQAAPESAWPRFLRHRLLEESAGGPPPREILDDLAREVRDFVNPCLEVANACSSENDAPKMVEAFLLAYERRTDAMREQLGVIRELLSTEKVSESVFVLKDLLRHSPIPTEIHHRTGRLYLQVKQYGKAQRHLFLAHVEDPKNLDLTYDYACACYGNGRLDLAQLLCKEILKLGERDAKHTEKAKRMFLALRDRNKEGGGAP